MVLSVLKYIGSEGNILLEESVARGVVEHNCYAANALPRWKVVVAAVV